ncbi:MAG: hypothetical protein SGILL_002958, partial [Bacillariaceae sp.]
TPDIRRTSAGFIMSSSSPEMKRRKHSSSEAGDKNKVVTMDWKPGFVVETASRPATCSAFVDDGTVSSMSCCDQTHSTLTVNEANARAVQEALLIANGTSSQRSTSGIPSNISPSTYLAMTLKNRKLKERISPFSLEQAMFFEPYQEGDMELEFLRALRSNNLELLRNVAATHELEDVRNQFGENPVHLLCRMGMPTAILEYLVVDKNVPLNVRDRFGRSPLHNACMVAVPNFDNVEFLLEHAPRLFLFEDDSGNTPFECIPRRSFDRWIRFLSQRNILKRITSKLEQDTSLVVA